MSKSSGFSNLRGSRLAEEMNQRMRSSFLITWSRSSTSSEAMRVMDLTDESWRRHSSLALTYIPSMSLRSRSYWSGLRMKERTPLHSRLMVVSWPASSSSDELEMTCSRLKTPSRSPWAKTDMKSSSGSTMRFLHQGSYVLNHLADALGEVLHPPGFAAGPRRGAFRPPRGCRGGPAWERPSFRR